MAFTSRRASPDSLLLTRISPRGFPAGLWTLPGGGIDHGESPDDAVLREVYEETGLSCQSVRLVAAHDIHTVDHGRDDQWEDYHGIQLLYAISVDPRQRLEVIDTGGSTDCARWVPVDQLGDSQYPVLPMVTYVVENRAQFELTPRTG